MRGAGEHILETEDHLLCLLPLPLCVHLIHIRLHVGRSARVSDNERCKYQRIKQLLTRKRVEKPARGFGEKTFRRSRSLPGDVLAMLVPLRTVHFQCFGS